MKMSLAVSVILLSGMSDESRPHSVGKIISQFFFWSTSSNLIGFASTCPPYRKRNHRGNEECGEKQLCLLCTLHREVVNESKQDS